MNSWTSFPKVWNVGHPNLDSLLTDEVIVEEKVDGSQFSFGVFDGELKVRSKGAVIVLDAPEKMFNLAVEAVMNLKPLLTPGWTYRGEYLQKPKHNVLAYDRTPKDNIILFDINTDSERYLSREEKEAEAKRIGLEVVPVFFKGMLKSLEEFNTIMDNISVLGGQKIEGVVIKNYKQFGRDGKVLMGKHVSEKFKEMHKVDWKTENPTNNDIIAIIAQSLRTEARWLKSVQHLKEQGLLTNSPKDIGLLMKEVSKDVKEECSEEIKNKLMTHSWPKINRVIIAGLPEFYKELLLKEQFNE